MTKRNTWHLCYWQLTESENPSEVSLEANRKFRGWFSGVRQGETLPSRTPPRELEHPNQRTSEMERTELSPVSPLSMLSSGFDIFKRYSTQAPCEATEADTKLWPRVKWQRATVVRGNGGKNHSYKSSQRALLSLFNILIGKNVF